MAEGASLAASSPGMSSTSGLAQHLRPQQAQQQAETDSAGEVSTQDTLGSTQRQAGGKNQAHSGFGGPREDCEECLKHAYKQCPHDKRKDACRICSPHLFCQDAQHQGHNGRKSDCVQCNPGLLCATAWHTGQGRRKRHCKECRDCNAPAPERQTQVGGGVVLYQ